MYLLGNVFPYLQIYVRHIQSILDFAKKLLQYKKNLIPVTSPATVTCASDHL